MQALNRENVMDIISYCNLHTFITFCNLSGDFEQILKLNMEKEFGAQYLWRDHNLLHKHK